MMFPADIPPTLAEAFLLKPAITFLNHGSYGACPRPVFATYQHWQRTLEDDPVDFFARRFRPLMAEARARLAAYIGAHGDDVVFVPNTTNGMNIVARSLELQLGDEVLSTDHEYGAIERACVTCAASRVRGISRSPSHCHSNTHSRWLKQSGLG